ncbi:MAG: hypothetical protein WB771_12435 [Solirubrobacterales bacterium]
MTVAVRLVVDVVVGRGLWRAGLAGVGESDWPAVGGSEEMPMSVLTARVARNAIAAATSRPRSAKSGQRKEDAVT